MKKEESGSWKKMESESGKEMGRTTYLVRNKEATFVSNMDPLSGHPEIQMENHNLVDTLSRYLVIQRREIVALRREVTSRGLATAAGKKSYLEGTAYAPKRLVEEIPPQLVEQQKKKKGSSKINLLGVSLPYLVRDDEEALGLLLHESEELRHRIQSFVSVLRESRVPVSSEKVQKLKLMSDALARISHHITLWVKSHGGLLSSYDEHRVGWQSTWGSGTARCGSFDDITTLSSMEFTHCTPGIFPHSAVAAPALQIYSIKIVDLNVKLNWPLYVYGVVAARDAVDRNRNILFCRSRDNCQEVIQDDPFLCLTGPSRAIVAEDAVKFEVELKIKYAGAESPDAALFSNCYNYRSLRRHTKPEIRSCCCTAELSVERLAIAVQATIVGVRVVEGEWPFKYGCRVSCFMSCAADDIDLVPREVLLLDCRGEGMVKGSNGYLNLSRKVISVELQRMLKVKIEAYSSKSGLEALEGCVNFAVQPCQITTLSCPVGNSTVEVVVAWSLLAMDKLDLALKGYLTPTQSA